MSKYSFAFVAFLFVGCSAVAAATSELEAQPQVRAPQPRSLFARNRSLNSRYEIISRILSNKGDIKTGFDGATQWALASRKPTKENKAAGRAFVVKLKESDISPLYKDTIQDFMEDLFPSPLFTIMAGVSGGVVGLVALAVLCVSLRARYKARETIRKDRWPSFKRGLEERKAEWTEPLRETRRKKFEYQSQLGDYVNCHRNMKICDANQYELLTCSQIPENAPLSYTAGAFTFNRLPTPVGWFLESTGFGERSINSLAHIVAVPRDKTESPKDFHAIRCNDGVLLIIDGDGAIKSLDYDFILKHRFTVDQIFMRTHPVTELSAEHLRRLAVARPL